MASNQVNATRMDDKSLNKYISESGLCSRREADKLLEQGRVTLNGVVAQKGNRVKTGDVVKVNGKLIQTKNKVVYLAFHKPRGVTCTTDLKDKSNIIDFLRYPERIFPIGRLDKESDGLIFLTNDGDIVNKILRAGNNHDKEYMVTVDKPINPEFIKKMSSGVRILDTVTQPCSVTQVSKNTFKIILRQGLNRQIRRMAETLGYEVKKLTRTRIMHISLGKLPLGKWRYFTTKEMDRLHQLVAASSKTKEASEIRK